MSRPTASPSRRRSPAFCVALLASSASLGSYASFAHAEPVAAETSECHHRDALQLDLGLAVVGLAYERLLGRAFALQLEGQVFGTWFGPQWDLPNFTGFGAQVRPTWFTAGSGPRGLYVAPFARVDAVRASKNGFTGRGVGWSAGVFVGWSFVIAEVWNVRVGAGAQYMSYAVDAGPEQLVFRRPFPALDLVVGRAL